MLCAACGWQSTTPTPAPTSACPRCGAALTPAGRGHRTALEFAQASEAPAARQEAPDEPMDFDEVTQLAGDQFADMLSSLHESEGDEPTRMEAVPPEVLAALAGPPLGAPASPPGRATPPPGAPSPSEAPPTRRPALRRSAPPTDEARGTGEIPGAPAPLSSVPPPLVKPPAVALRPRALPTQLGRAASSAPPALDTAGAPAPNAPSNVAGTARPLPPRAQPTQLGQAAAPAFPRPSTAPPPRPSAAPPPPRSSSPGPSAAPPPPRSVPNAVATLHGAPREGSVAGAPPVDSVRPSPNAPSHTQPLSAVPAAGAARVMPPAPVPPPNEPSAGPASWGTPAALLEPQGPNWGTPQPAPAVAEPMAALWGAPPAAAPLGAPEPVWNPAVVPAAPPPSPWGAPAPTDAAYTPPPPPAPEPPKGGGGGRKAVAAIAVLVGLALLGGAGVLAWQHWQSQQSPLLTAAAIDATGRDIELVCEQCPDGTEWASEVGGGTFQGSRSRAVLTQPLPLGANALAVSWQRPGGPHERTTVPVQLEFRLDLDERYLQQFPPKLRVTAHATAGATLQLDGRTLQLDENGQAQHDFEVGTVAVGNAGDVTKKVLEFRYEYMRPGAPSQRGSLRRELSVLPLVLFSPVNGTVLTQDRVRLQGQAPAGTQVQLAGQKALPDERGLFQLEVPIPLGAFEMVAWVSRTEQALEAPGASARNGVARGVPLTVVRAPEPTVTQWLAAVRSLESRPAVNANALWSSPNGQPGARVEFAGVVIEVKERFGEIATLIDLASRPRWGLRADAITCPSRTCLVRVVSSGKLVPKQGQTIQGIGRLAAPRDAQTPEIDAALLLPVPAP